MNNLTMPMKFTEMRVETVSVVRCLTRFALCLSWVVFTLALPGRAQTPASEHQTITVEELQQMALQNNPTFKQSAANIQAAEGRKKQSGLYPNPTVGYQGEQMRASLVRKEIRKHGLDLDDEDALIFLAKRFRVSTVAMTYRLNALGLLR